MPQIIKENFLYLLAIIAVFVLGVYFSIEPIKNTVAIVTEYYAQKTSVETLQEKVAMLRAQAEERKHMDVTKDGKRVYEMEGMQFSPNASFAPLFEMVLTVAQSSGIRIRSIEYNYAPDTDPIFASKLPGYNICELSITAVGSYSEFQNFFKGVMKDANLTYLAEVEMAPWEKDKSILINKFKLRLYTRTPQAS